MLAIKAKNVGSPATPAIVGPWSLIAISKMIPGD